MVIAWMMSASTAMLMAKYYKPMWPNHDMCKEKVWFAVSSSGSGSGSSQVVVVVVRW